jgi:alkanesulfonate monooxygenase SsuD/methylene tetrahydromethanopterin reductase-like flavin-dependent oxidoreductase (luciferase family)
MPEINTGEEFSPEEAHRNAARFHDSLVGPSVSDASALSAFARGLEDLGYDALWIGDRLVTPVPTR